MADASSGASTTPSKLAALADDEDIPARQRRILGKRVGLPGRHGHVCEKTLHCTIRILPRKLIGSHPDRVRHEKWAPAGATTAGPAAISQSTGRTWAVCSLPRSWRTRCFAGSFHTPSGSHGVRSSRRQSEGDRGEKGQDLAAEPKARPWRWRGISNVRPLWENLASRVLFITAYCNAEGTLLPYLS
jgi:hypothetical protein